MRVESFSYDLPPERIAQFPTEQRDGARLMRIAPSERAPQHFAVTDLPSLIPDGAVVVVNNTRVVRSRLLGRKSASGGKVEIFLIRRIGTRSCGSPARELDVWKALGKSSKALRFGTTIKVGSLIIELLGRSEEDGLLEVGLYVDGGGSVESAIREVGHVPLPPYIKRQDSAEDSERYQTIFAHVDGAVAAPTAGLHLTRSLMSKLGAKGCTITPVTLHVGLGTFQPVTVADFDQHPMHSEWFEVPAETVSAIEQARARGTAVIAVGTTVVRALESAADVHNPGRVLQRTGDTRLLIQPGYNFNVVDMLLTNFHLPKSTLLALVCAFGGTERVLDAYKLAVDEQYRFFSYGDAMLLSRNPS